MGYQQPLITFAEDMAVLLNSGADVHTSVATIIETLPEARMKPVLSKVRAELRQGQPLHLALAGYPHIFDQYYLGMVKSGEASGRLADSMSRLARQLENDRELRGQIANALIYPSILLLAMAISLAVILGLILPKFVDLFESMNAQLSPAAEALLGLGKFFNAWGFWIAAGLAICALLAWLFRDTLRPGRWAIAACKAIPALRNSMDQVDFARFTATLASLLESGMPQTEALTIAASGCKYAHNREQLQRVIQRVNQGEPLGSCLADLNGVGSLYAPSISNGELGGQLPQTLQVLAERLEKDFSRRAQRIAMLVEPAMIMGLGLLVGLIVYTVFSALQNLADLPL